MPGPEVSQTTPEQQLPSLRKQAENALIAAQEKAKQLAELSRTMPAESRTPEQEEQLQAMAEEIQGLRQHAAALESQALTEHPPLEYAVSKDGTVLTKPELDQEREYRLANGTPSEDTANSDY